MVLHHSMELTIFLSIIWPKRNDVKYGVYGLVCNERFHISDKVPDKWHFD